MKSSRFGVWFSGAALVSVSLLAGLMVVVVPVGPASARLVLKNFTSPSRNIFCLMSVDEESCQAEGVGRTVTHRIPVLFDGTRFTVAPTALKTATCLDAGELGGQSPTTYCPKIR